MSTDIENADNAHVDKEDEIKEHIYDKCHRFRIGRWKFLRLDFNPVVTFISAIIIWALVIWCMVEPKKVSAHYFVVLYQNLKKSSDNKTSLPQDYPFTFDLKKCVIPFERLKYNLQMYYCPH